MVRILAMLVPFAPTFATRRLQALTARLRS